MPLTLAISMCIKVYTIEYTIVKHQNEECVQTWQQIAGNGRTPLCLLFCLGSCPEELFRDFTSYDWNQYEDCTDAKLRQVQGGSVKELAEQRDVHDSC